MEKTDKSAECILLNKVGKLALSGLKWKSLDDRKQLILQAMNEYAAQQLSEYKDIIKDLLPLTEAYMYITTSKEKGENIKSIIDRAKKLIDK